MEKQNRTISCTDCMLLLNFPETLITYNASSSSTSDNTRHLLMMQMGFQSKTKHDQMWHGSSAASQIMKQTENTYFQIYCEHLPRHEPLKNTHVSTLAEFGAPGGPET